MIKKIFALLLCAVMLLPIVSACDSNGDIPDGMYSVTLDGEPFILYVPEQWTDNRDSGISSAYYSMNNRILVSARYYPSDPEAELTDHVKAIAAQNAEILSGYAADEENSIKDATLDSADAVKYEYTYDYGANDEAKTDVVQYYALHGEDIVVLSMYVADGYEEEEIFEAFKQIHDEFKLCDKADTADEVFDEDTPDGMKIASDEDVQYICYVPKTWVTNIDDRLTYAYYPESGNPNITVTSFSPSTTTTAEQYFIDCEIEYKKNISGYERVGDEPEAITVAERNALSYQYKAVYGGSEYKIMQTVLIYNDLAYSITYTARAEAFDAHLEDVKAILNAFRFR